MQNLFCQESGDTAGCMSNSMERHLMKAMGLCGESQQEKTLF